MRQNFILITTDQQRADHLGCYGNQVLRTPNIDRLAERGRQFNRFYVACPICMPNRATLMTGRMPSVHGVHCNGISLPLRSNTLCELLRAAGYRTALVGKSHLQNMTGLPPQKPRPAVEDGHLLPPPRLAEAELDAWGDGSYEQESLARWSADPTCKVETPFYGFDHVELCTMHGDLVHGDYYRWLNERVEKPDQLRGPNNALSNPRITVPQAYRTRVPEELYPTRYIEERSLAYLEQAQSSDQPFFLHCSFTDPHHPFTPPGKYWDLYDPDQVDVPVSLVDEAAPTHAVAALRRQTAAGKINLRGTVPFAVSERHAREAIALTYGMIGMIDDAVGNILNALAALGLDDNTTVIFSSDHGDFMGDHGLMLKTALHYQGLIRVPFIWSEPDLPTAGTDTQALCGTLDIAPTILHRAGITPFYGMQGMSLLPIIQGASDQAHRAVLVEEDGHEPTFGLDRAIRARSVVTDRYRLSIFDPPEWVELYDLQTDPQEMRNMADDPAHAGVRAELFEVLSHRMMELADHSPYPTARA